MSNVETQALEAIFPAPVGHTALAYWIPISMRERVVAAYRAAGIPIRIRYRGPRAVSIGRIMTRPDGSTYRRSKVRAYQDCLMTDAEYFSVYKR